MAERCNFMFHGDEETDGPRTVDGGNRDENGGDTSGLSHRDVILRPDREELLVMKEKSGQGKKEILASRIPSIERNIELITGYSVELVNDGSLRLGLLCICCNKIARDAMQTSIGHRICEPCAERIKKSPGSQCADCGLNVAEDVPRPDYAARKEIKSLIIYCSFQIPGCEWQGELQSLEFHLKACEYKPEPCEQCKELVPAKFMGEHLKKECRRRPVQCEYCSADLEYCQVKEHLETCPLYPVSCSACQEQVIQEKLEDHRINDCKYKECTACGEQILRDEFKNHVKQDSTGHFVLLADKVAILKTQVKELKASKEHVRTRDERTASPLGGDTTSAQLSASVQELRETIGFLAVRVQTGEKALKDLQNLYEQEKKKKNTQLEDRIAQLESQQQLLATNVNHGPITVTNSRFGTNIGVTNYNFSRHVTPETKHAIDSPPSSVSSGYSSIDDMDTRLTNLEHKVEKVYARDADFNKRTSNLEETVRVLQNTLTDIHPTDKGSQAVVRAGEIVPQDKQQTYLMEKRMGELEQQVTTLSTQCTDLELQLQASLVSTYNGDFLWRIPDVSRRIRDAKTGKVTSVYSPPFFSAHTGYKMCIRAYLNGDGMGEKTHLSLFFVIMKGEFDALLSWPFQSRITLTLINQDNRSGDVREVFRANPQSKSFQRPTSEMNVASGCPKFVPLEYLNNPSYVKQDVLYIRCSVDTSFLTHP